MEKYQESYSKKLETERLILKKFDKNDFEMLYKNYVSDESVPKYCTWKPCKTQEEANELLGKWFKGYEDPEKLMWMIVEKKSNQGIGVIRVTNKWIEENKCEIGYSCGSKWWNKGYMTEAVKKVLEYLTKSIGFDTIIAEISEDNIASKKVMENAGAEVYESKNGKLHFKYNCKKDRNIEER